MIYVTLAGSTTGMYAQGIKALNSTITVHTCTVKLIIITKD